MKHNEYAQWWLDFWKTVLGLVVLGQGPRLGPRDGLQLCKWTRPAHGSGGEPGPRNPLSWCEIFYRVTRQFWTSPKRPWPLAGVCSLWWTRVMIRTERRVFITTAKVCLPQGLSPLSLSRCSVPAQMAGDQNQHNPHSPRPTNERTQSSLLTGR